MAYHLHPALVKNGVYTNRQIYQLIIMIVIDFLTLYINPKESPRSNSLPPFYPETSGVTGTSSIEGPAQGVCGSETNQLRCCHVAKPILGTDRCGYVDYQTSIAPTIRRPPTPQKKGFRDQFTGYLVPR